MSAKLDERFVTLICPNLNCARPNNVPITARGKAMRCPFCNTAFRVPESAGHDESGAESAKKKS